MKKLMEFKIKPNREPATLRHFEIWADNISFKDHKNKIPVCTADGILMYEFTGTEKYHINQIEETGMATLLP